MEKTLLVTDQEARRLYKTSSPEWQQVLENNFSKAFFSEKITDRIKTFEDACEYNNTNPLAKRFTVGTRNQIYQERVAEIVKALNEGWIPNYDDSSEAKYGPYFYLNAPGFRFCVSYYVNSNSYATGGSRFALRTRALSDYAGTQFTKEYEMWMTPEKENASSMNVNGCSLAPKPFTGTMEEWEKYIMERVNSFEDGCRERGVDPESYEYCTGTPDEIAYKKGKLFCDVLNGPFMHLMKDTVSRKWYAWMEKTDTGFRFNGSLCDFTYSFTTGGSRLRLCSEKLAKHFATKAAGMMAPYWWNE